MKYLQVFEAYQPNPLEAFNFVIDVKKLTLTEKQAVFQKLKAIGFVWQESKIAPEWLDDTLKIVHLKNQHWCRLISNKYWNQQVAIHGKVVNFDGSQFLAIDDWVAYVEGQEMGFFVNEN